MTPALVMGVLNVTPDSFSDGGRYLDRDAAIEHGLRLWREGAAYVDVGGESTRPGAAPVDPDEERTRVVPVIEALVAAGVRVSVDTRTAAVAEASIAAGASMLNDVSASLHEVAAAAGVAWVAMHMRGEPGTMQDAPVYDDVVAEVRSFLVERADAALAAGVPEVWIDPGIGFGKTAAHNLSLLRHVDLLVETGHPVLVGTSRKRFLGALTGGADEDDRLEGTLATCTWVAATGVKMVRVHDVAPAVEAMRIVGEEVVQP
ncbi:MAG TPA: dihydropteroate synthase [Acidimicrobiales bacterium]|nr:dihydropteroate synthase [Acidimicrobiales bacterium]